MLSRLECQRGAALAEACDQRRHQNVGFRPVDREDVDLRQVVEKGAAARRELAHAGIDGDERSVRLRLVDDHGIAVGGLVGEVRDVNEIHGEGLVTQIARREQSVCTAEGE